MDGAKAPNKEVSMKNEQVLYDGRLVSKDGFRAFVYNENGDRRLTNSWDEFQKNIKSGLWFENPVEKLFSNDNKKRRKAI